jgi:enoyl-CoA hydratase/carnithine racemase
VYGLATIGVAREGDVLVATIDRPGSELNAVDGQLHADLAALFARLKRESTARAVLLTGSKRAFSAGGDYAWFPTLRSVEQLEHLRRDAKQMIWDLLDVELPIVAGLNGPAVGLGASVALLCDVVVMADSAVIADPHVRIGVVAGDGGAALGATAAPIRAIEPQQSDLAVHGTIGIETETDFPVDVPGTAMCLHMSRRQQLSAEEFAAHEQICRLVVADAQERLRSAGHAVRPASLRPHAVRQEVGSYT